MRFSADLRDFLFLKLNNWPNNAHLVFCIRSDIAVKYRQFIFIFWLFNGLEGEDELHRNGTQHS